MCKQTKNTRLLEQIFYLQLKEGLRGIGRPRLRFKDIVKRNLNGMKIPIGSWQSLGRNQNKWRNVMHRKSSSNTKNS